MRCSCSTCRRSMSPRASLNALRRVVSFAVDQLLEIALAFAQPLGHLVQRVPPFGGVLLELRVRLLHHLLTLAREVGAQAGHELPLLLDGGLQPVGVLADLRIRLRHQHLLAGLDAFHVVCEALLELADVARPVGEPLLDRSLGRDELLAEPFGGHPFALRDVAAPLLRDPPLLFRELRQRVGAQPGERVLELLRPLGELLGDDLVEGRSAALDLAFEHPLVRSNLLQHERARDQREHGDDRRDDGDDGGDGHTVIVGAPPRGRRRSMSKRRRAVAAHARAAQCPRWSSVRGGPPGPASTTHAAQG